MTVSPTLQNTAFYRPTWAEIDAGAFRRNARALARVLKPGVRMILVLKADGYGHGAAALALAAARDGALPLWGFGVSSVEEGAALRAAGVTQKILILGSLYPFENVEAAVTHGLVPTVASFAAAEGMAKLAQTAGRPFGVHLKIDTGMGRIGVSPETAGAILKYIIENPSLRLDGVYTHLAQADSETQTREQLDLFRSALKPWLEKGPKALLHAANSAATIRYSDSHFDAVRPGLALYGLHAQPDLSEKIALDPVLSWKTRVVFLKTVRPGARISYGGTFQAKRPSRLATLPVGYADGYRRSFSNRAQVLVRGKRCPVVGRVTMDQSIVDVTDAPGVDVGDEVVLVGAQGVDRIRVEELAGWADTIPYEVVCGISRRVPRVVVGQDA